jgi:hypothetical protein
MDRAKLNFHQQCQDGKSDGSSQCLELDIRPNIASGQVCAQSVNQLFAAEKPDQVYLAAAKVGGIYANMSEKKSFLADIPKP